METKENFSYGQAIDIKIGDLMLINDYPCKIIERTASKTGKHGGSKVHFMGIDIFTKKKYSMLHGSGDKVKIPIIIRADYQLVDINEDEDCAYLILMSLITQTLREDVRLPDNEIGEKIKESYDNEEDIVVTIHEFSDQIAIVAYKINRED